MFKVISVIFFIVSAQSSPDDLYRTAMLAFKRGLYATARAKFDELVESYPDSDYAPKALLNSALCDKNLKNYDSAVSKFEKVENRYPDSDSVPLAVFWKAQTYLAMGDYINASRTARRFVENYPHHKLVPLALYTSGYAMLLAGRYSSAVDDLKKCVENYPGSRIYEKALYRYAQALYLSGRKSEAEKRFEEFLKKYRSSKYYPNALYFYGKILYEKGRFYDARRYLALSVKKKTDYSEEAEFLFALSLAGEKKFHKAEKSLKFFIRKYPDSHFAPEVYLRLAVVERALGKTDESLKWSEKAIKHPFSTPDVRKSAVEEWIMSVAEGGKEELVEKFDEVSEPAGLSDQQKSELLFKSSVRAFEYGKKETAHKLLLLALSKGFSPKNTDYFTVSKVFFSSQDYENALKWVEKYLSLFDESNKNYPEGLYIAVVSALKLGDVKSARLHYSRLLNLYPSSQYVAVAFGELVKSIKDKKNLAELYREFISKSKKVSAVHLFNAGVLLMGEGKDDEAIKMFEKVVKDFHDSALAVKSAIKISEYHCSKGNYGRAVEVLREVEPSSRVEKFELLSARAWIMFDWGKYAEAEKIYRKSLKFAPKDKVPDVWEKIAMCRYNLGDHRGAEKILERKVLPFKKKAEDKIRVLLGVLRSSIAENNTPKVVEISEEALSYSVKVPELEELLFKSAEYLRTEGKCREAVKLYEKLLSLFPSGDYREDAEFWYADCLSKMKNFDKSAGVFEKFLEEFPDSVHREKAVRFLAKYYSDKNDTKRAEQLYKELLVKGSNDAKKEALSFLANLEMKRMNYGNAVKYFEKLMGYVEGEDRVKIAEKLSEIYSKLGNSAEYEKTLRFIVNSSTVESEKVPAMMKLAELEIKRGNVEEAREWLAKIYYEHKNSKLAPEALFKLAETYRGNAQAEKEILSELVKVYPDTVWSDKAKVRLRELESETSNTNSAPSVDVETNTLSTNN